MVLILSQVDVATQDPYVHEGVQMGPLMIVIKEQPKKKRIPVRYRFSPYIRM